MGKKVVVKVPATTGNLGPGFDVLGMALNLYNIVELEEPSNCYYQIEIEGEGEKFLPRNSDNLVCRAINILFKRAFYRSPGWKLRLINKIPLQRGLGSSAAAIVGGLVAANSITGNPFSFQELLTQAIELEGHPDNVAAALLGGIVVIVKQGDSYYYKRFFPSEGIKIYAVIPSFELSTSVARSVLPEVVPLQDAVFNLGRVALLTFALQEGNWDLLRIAVHDRLHQPYRRRLIPGLDEAMKAAKEAGAYGTFLSGAGPTVISFASSGSLAGEAMGKVFRAYGFETRVLELEPSPQGARVTEFRE